MEENDEEIGYKVDYYSVDGDYIPYEKSYFTSYHKDKEALLEYLKTTLHLHEDKIVINPIVLS